MRRSSKLVTAACLCTAMAAAGLQVQGAVASPSVRDSERSSDQRGPVRKAIARLKADTPTSLRIHRDGEGDGDGLVDFVGSVSGHGIDNPQRPDTAGPVASARSHAQRYAAMFGVAAPVEELEVSGHGPLAGGGSLVRMQQNVSGLPVLGGQLAVSMDSAGDLTSIVAETTRADRAGVASVAVASARRTALVVTAKAHDVPVATLTAHNGEVDPLGPRTVWRFEVGNGYDVRELVLVDARSGRLALHFNQVAHVLNRVVCDNQEVERPFNQNPRLCTLAGSVRNEGDAATNDLEIDGAFDHAGATSNLYAAVSGIDLTRMIGIDTTAGKRLASTVRWCFTEPPGGPPDELPCPSYPNAFWSGRQMYYGDGFAAADDVVGHELSHGVIENTSNLFYFHQSGAINESLADIVGEIVDHRFASPGDVAGNWDLGEDVPGGRVRSLRNPPLENQPDKMTSGRWVADVTGSDNGGVHSNSGVGNKTAYLISQGGTFNGRSVNGVDGADTRLSRSARLWVDVIRRLVSGSDYADLGRVLVQTCNELAASTASFTPAHCANVRKAVAATELGRQPTVANASAPEAPATCPTSTFKRVLFRENVEKANTRWKAGALWRRAPFRDTVPTNATSGTRSFFGFDPDPAVGNPRSSPLSMRRLVRLPAGQRSFLHFRHSHLFEFRPGMFFDGGVVRVRNSGTGSFRPTTSLPWVNGPTKRLRHGVAGVPGTGFGGISHGYVSSRLNLSSMAGKRVQLQWMVAGDQNGSILGWFLDDIEIYACPSALPSAPRNVQANAAARSAVVTWRRPAGVGTGISAYRITRVDGPSKQVSASARRVRFTNLRPGRTFSFRVRALNRSGAPGPAVRATVSLRR